MSGAAYNADVNSFASQVMRKDKNCNAGATHKREAQTLRMEGLVTRHELQYLQ